MRYVGARLAQKDEDLTYRFYVTDILKCIAENTAASVQGGKYIKARFYDIMKKKDGVEETRSSEEIVKSISDKLRRMSDG